MNNVALSGGPLAGKIADGSAWTPGQEKNFPVLEDGARVTNWRGEPLSAIYRRLEDDGDSLTDDQAVFCGLTTEA